MGVVGGNRGKETRLGVVTLIPPSDDVQQALALGSKPEQRAVAGLLMALSVDPYTPRRQVELFTFTSFSSVGRAAVGEMGRPVVYTQVLRAC